MLIHTTKGCGSHHWDPSKIRDGYKPEQAKPDKDNEPLNLATVYIINRGLPTKVHSLLTQSLFTDDLDDHAYFENKILLDIYRDKGDDIPRACLQ